MLRPAGQRLVWPGPPAEARVELLGTIERDFTRGVDGARRITWQRVLWGEESSNPGLVTPQAVAVHADGTRLAIADPNAACVHVLKLETNRYQRIAKDGDVRAVLEAPVAVAWLEDALWIADAKQTTILKVREGSTPQVFGMDVFQRPAGLAVDSIRKIVYVSDAGRHEIIAMDSQGNLIHRFGTRGSGDGQLNFPAQLAVAPDGSVVVADALNFRIQRFDPEGQFQHQFGRKGNAGGDFALPKGVAVDSRGQTWVVDAQFENVQAFDSRGRLLMAFGGEGPAPGQFWLPAGVAIDTRDRLWIADTYNRRIQVFQLRP